MFELGAGKADLGKELDEAALKNQQLMNLMKSKQGELQEMQRYAEQSKSQKKQIQKLEEIIDDL